MSLLYIEEMLYYYDNHHDMPKILYNHNLGKDVNVQSLHEYVHCQYDYGLEKMKDQNLWPKRPIQNSFSLVKLLPYTVVWL